MRNLKLQYCKQFAARVPDAKFLLFDPVVERNVRNVAHFVTANRLYALCAGDLVEMAEVPGTIVAAEYLLQDNLICLATAEGEVLTVDTEAPYTLTEATFCDVGISAMAWSPEQDCVVFATSTANVVVMNSIYDVVGEHVLASGCDGKEQFVNVGWGKKETQFHGSEGKSAAKQKGGFRPPANVAELPQNIEITWRGDGAYFAVSFVSVEFGRMFKVFIRQSCTLVYVSEPTADLQPPIAMRPSGTWLAVPQLLPNKSVVALFEKNGLRHREIVLPFGLEAEPILSFRWCPESTILVMETLHKASQCSNLYFYTIGNYHWYLKQTLRFDSADPLVFYTWDIRYGAGETLYVLLKSGKYFMYRFHFDIDKYERSGVVAVIDGSKLLLTDFSKAVVPPPMCSQELQLTATDGGDPININACTFSASADHAALQLCVYDAAEHLHLYRASLQQTLQFEKVAELQAAQGELSHLGPGALATIFWLNERQLVVRHSDEASTKIHLITLSCDTDTKSGVYEAQRTFTLDCGTVNALCAGSAAAEQRQLYAQTLDGKIHELTLPAGDSRKALVPVLHAQLENAGDHLLWSDGGRPAVFSLRTDCSLHLDGQRIAEDVSSFCLAGNYLAFTQLATLCFYGLKARRIVDKRRIEQGAKLVTTVAQTARTVLQMPRGNLEAILPLALSLEIVGELLDQKRYYDVMVMLRKQRINLNIMCDHSVGAFVENLQYFLGEIKDPTWLNLFLSDLKNEDFTQTMYASNYKAGAQVYPPDFKIDQKIEYLCKKLIEIMNKKSATDDASLARYRLPIITAYVKMGQVEKALELIWKQKKQQEQAALDASADGSAESTLKYLLYLVDVNQLYNVALGTYDFGLVLFVAQKSQKDPREFLPFLNELRALESHYCKFKIDEHLKRNEKALVSIAAAANVAPEPKIFEEALAFIKRHGLYAKALACFREQPVPYRSIALACGDYLRAKGKLEEASFMYEQAENYEQAMLSAKHVLDWRRALYLALKKGATPEEISSLAVALAVSLQENGRHDEAFELLKVNAKSFAQAISCLTQGKLFVKAVYESRMHPNNQQLLSEIVIPSIEAHCNMLRENLTSDSSLFNNYKMRLLAIREKKAKTDAGVHDSDEEENDVDESDLLSDTSSMRSSRYTASSRGTGKTFRSSKNRRKHERKLLSLKPGNAFEDIALIDALHNLAMHHAAQQASIRETCKALIELKAEDIGALIQREYKKLLALIQGSLDEIWIPEMMAAQPYLTGPNIDYTMLRNEQRYAMIDPQKRFKPQLNIIEWEMEIL